MRVRDREGLARVFRHFGEVETPRLGGAVYTAFSLGVASDPERLDLVARVDPETEPMLAHCLAITSSPKRLTQSSFACSDIVSGS
jgi:hypothetical protein